MGVCKSRGKYKKQERRIFVRKPDRKGALGRPRRRWKDNIKIELQEVGCGGGAWTGSSWLGIGTGGGYL